MHIIVRVMDTPGRTVLFVTILAGTVSFGELLFELHSVTPLKMMKIKTPIIKIGTIVNIALPIGSGSKYIYTLQSYQLTIIRLLYVIVSFSRNNGFIEVAN